MTCKQMSESYATKIKKKNDICHLLSEAELAHVHTQGRRITTLLGHNSCKHLSILPGAYFLPIYYYLFIYYSSIEQNKYFIVYFYCVYSY